VSESVIINELKSWATTEAILELLDTKFGAAAPDDLKARAKAEDDPEGRFRWFLKAHKPTVTTLAQFRNEAGI
jgi:hypothetical protein